MQQHVQTKSFFSKWNEKEQEMASSLYCLCNDQPVLSQDVINFVSLGTHAAVLLQVVYFFDSVLRSGFEYVQGKTLLITAYRLNTWILWALLLVLQYIIQWERIGLADQDTSSVCRGPGGQSCSAATSFLWSSLNNYGFPDVVACTVFPYGSLAIYWDRVAFGRFNWQHVVLLVVTFVWYSISELSLHRSSPLQWALNSTVTLGITAAFLVGFQLMHNRMHWLLRDLGRNLMP
jgi:hypothetical protein